MEETLKNTNVDNDNFLDNPQVIAHKTFLQDLGVWQHIDSLTSEIRNYKSILERSMDILNSTNIDQIMDATVNQISDQFLPSFIAFIWKPIQTREDVTMRAYKNYKPINIDLQVDSITPFEAFFKQYPKPIQFELLAYQLNNEEAVKPYRDVKTEIVVPILGPFGLYGIILVGNKIMEDEYNRDELYFLQQLMCFVSQAIKNHLHYEHSLRDVKTGLYNHGFFIARLDEELARTKRGGHKSSIMVMDVDRFKKFNDTYGHLAGDRVLEQIAQTIRHGIRGEDIPSRFGGEEFTILLPNTDQSTVWNVAERLRTSIAQMKIQWDVPLPSVTISIGIYTFDHNTNSDVSAIIHRADEALYISKERGRNRCTVWNPGLVDPSPEEGCSIEKILVKNPITDVL